MRRIALLLFVASSLLNATAETRPHYGGTLRIALRMAPVSLDPATANPYDSVAARNVSHLIFDRLLTLDDRGYPQPALATSWQPEPGSQRWRFNLRKDVMCHDGSPLTSDIVAASLRTANAHWKVFPSADAITIETDSPSAYLPLELTLARYGIAKRVGNKLIGTGPYSIAQWDPGKRLTLAARDDYWNGRPFVDTIEIALGKNLREQMISLDVGTEDLIEVSPEQAQHASMENRRVESSSAAELMALVFAQDAKSLDEGRLRQTLAASIDRASLSKVLFQGGAEPAAGLLPNWMTGYAFLFPTSTDASLARQIRGDARQGSPWTLGYDATDATARVVAERIALNARDAGLTVQLTSSGSPDIRLLRAPLAALDDRVALAELTAMTGLPTPKFAGDSIEDIYAAEAAILNSQRVIPLLHIRVAFGVGRTVRNWSADRDGMWHLDDAWLSAEKP
jgi:peptide/nickel transport system substrate-binding protein